MTAANRTTRKRCARCCCKPWASIAWTRTGSAHFRCPNFPTRRQSDGRRLLVLEVPIQDQGGLNAYPDTTPESGCADGAGARLAFARSFRSLDTSQRAGPCLLVFDLHGTRDLDALCLRRSCPVQAFGQITDRVAADGHILDQAQ